MKNFELGDIVIFRYPSSSQSREEGMFGLVYESKKDELQILYMMSEEKLDYLYPVKLTSGDLIDGNLLQDYFVISGRMLLIKKESVVRKLGRISVQKIDEILRQMAFNIFEKHYNVVHKKDEEFIPGKTYIRYAGRVYDAEEMKYLVDSALDFWLTAGRFAEEFESKMADFLGVKYCILTNSGSSANLLAISALTSPKLDDKRLKPGDEVITIAAGFPTTVAPIVQNGLIPVFVDIDLGTYNVNVGKLKEAISERTRAIFLAHTLGNPLDLDPVMELVDKYDLWLIEDNCDALGTRYKGRYTGTFGYLATLSFYPAHHITMGEGGAVLTDDTQLKRIVVSLRDWGRDCWCSPGCDNTCGKRFGWQFGSLPFGYDHKYIYSHLGYNLKVTDMQAAVGVAQLKKLPEFIRKRRENFQKLYEGLRQFEDFFIFPQVVEGAEPSWFGFFLTIKDDAPFSWRDIVSFLESHKIATRLLFAGNMVRQPVFEGIKYKVVGDLKNTDKVMNDGFWIGVYPGLEDEEINYVISKFDEFIAIHSRK